MSATLLDPAVPVSEHELPFVGDVDVAVNEVVFCVTDSVKRLFAPITVWKIGPMQSPPLAAVSDDDPLHCPAI